MLQYFISRSAYAYQERRDGKDESIDLYQISIFIKQIAFAAMETGISEEIINQVVPAAIGKSWELASKLLFDPHGRHEACHRIIWQWEQKSYDLWNKWKKFIYPNHGQINRIKNKKPGRNQLQDDAWVFIYLR